MAIAYGEDVAYIHDIGFSGVATAAAQRLLEELRDVRLHAGTVMDLGCGSGVLASQLSDAAYAVIGVDISAAMIEIARKRVPEAEFRVNSFVSVDLPTCVAVTAIGEVLNYAFDERNSSRVRTEVFRRAYEALVPGGLLMFDLAGPGRAPRGPHRTFTEGPDWAVLVEVEVDEPGNLLTRNITSFRQVGALYRRDTEIHRLLLVEPAEALESLRSIGFQVRTFTRYAAPPLPAGVLGFLAQKPRSRDD